MSMATTNNFNTFPDELYLQIFSRLNLCNIRNCSLVSKKWAHLTKSDLIWENLLSRDFLYYGKVCEVERFIREKFYLFEPSFQAFLKHVSIVWKTHPLSLDVHEYAKNFLQEIKTSLAASEIAKSILFESYKPMPADVLKNSSFYDFYKKKFSKLSHKENELKLYLIELNMSHIMAQFKGIIKIDKPLFEKEKVCLWGERAKLRNIFQMYNMWENRIGKSAHGLKGSVDRNVLFMIAASSIFLIYLFYRNIKTMHSASVPLVGG